MDRLMLIYNYNAIPNRLKSLMKARGFTRESLARKMGWENASSLSQYLTVPKRGTQRVPSLETLCRFANALDCDIEYLLGVLPEGVYRREVYDVMSSTGLSYKAVTNLQCANSYGLSQILSDLLANDKIIVLAQRINDLQSAYTSHGGKYQPVLTPMNLLVISGSSENEYRENIGKANELDEVNAVIDARERRVQNVFDEIVSNIVRGANQHGKQKGKR